jgi:mannose/cellobiose epimerase-like protein (N-acyl-D-glucosamine 2-epimerase family)
LKISSWIHIHMFLRINTITGEFWNTWVRYCTWNMISGNTGRWVRKWDGKGKEIKKKKTHYHYG